MKLDNAVPISQFPKEGDGVPKNLKCLNVFIIVRLL
jgi:hypothetical protein